MRAPRHGGVRLARENDILTRLLHRDGVRPCDLFPGRFVPSWVANTLEALADHDLVVRSPRGEYTLTPAGRQEAENVGARTRTGRPDKGNCSDLRYEERARAVFGRGWVGDDAPSRDNPSDDDIMRALEGD